MYFSLDEYDTDQQDMLNACAEADEITNKIKKLRKRKKRKGGKRYKKERKKLEKRIRKLEKRLKRLEKYIVRKLAALSPYQREWWQELLLQNCPELIRALSAYLNQRALCLPSKSSNLIPTEARDVDEL